MRHATRARWNESVRAVWIGIVVVVGLPMLMPTCGAPFRDGDRSHDVAPASSDRRVEPAVVR